MVNSIPWAKLDEGIRLICRNIQQLIENSDLLYQNKKFMHAASLAVIAFEEMSKADLLITQHKNRNDLPLTDWKKLTEGRSAHTDKLMKFLEKKRLFF